MLEVGIIEEFIELSDWCASVVPIATVSPMVKSEFVLT